VSVLLVFVGGAVGAVARYLTDRAIQARHDMLFPWGTFTVNLTGSALLGVLVALSVSAPSWLLMLVGTGFCGAFTTFSTFTFETYRLLEEGAVLEAGLNAALSLVCGVAVASLAFLGVQALP
jgi:fluoride exporter